MTDYVIETQTVRTAATTLSLMIWRRFLRPMPGLLEDTLGRNPGLADLGPILPVGTSFDLRVDTPRNTGAGAALAPISLW